MASKWKVPGLFHCINHENTAIQINKLIFVYTVETFYKKWSRDRGKSFLLRGSTVPIMLKFRGCFTLNTLYSKAVTLSLGFTLNTMYSKAVTLSLGFLIIFVLSMYKLLR